MLTRRVASRCRGPGWRRWATLVALLGAGTLVTDFSQAAPAAQRGARSARAMNNHDALPNVTYTGFRLLKDGRSVVYVELTGKVPVTVQKQRNLIIFELEGAQISLKNNRNPLITSQFASILESARWVVVKPARAGKRARQAESAPPRVQLVLRLREDVTATHTLSERPSGALLEVTLPAAGLSGSKS